MLDNTDTRATSHTQEYSVNTTQTSLVAQHHIRSYGPLKIPLLLQLKTAAAAMQTTVSQ